MNFYCSHIEKNLDFGPIKIDIDLEVPAESYTEGRLYNDDIQNRCIKA